MSRKHVFWMAVLSMLLIVPVAHAAAPGTWVISGNGGMSLPTGDFGGSDPGQFDANTGFQFGGAIDYVLTEMFAVGVDGSWNQNKHDGEGNTYDLGGGVSYTVDEAKFSTWQVGAHVKYMIPTGASPVSPYLGAGGGVYSTKLKWKETDTSGGVSTVFEAEPTTDSRFGFKVMGGAAYKATDAVSFGVEGDYNFVMLDKDKIRTDFNGSDPNAPEISSLQYLGVHAFVAWAFMPQ